MHELITNDAYALPQLAPDGNYCTSSITTSNETNSHSFQLHAAYPNPFNPVTAISYEIPIGIQFTVRIFDITGKMIKTLISNKQSAGHGIVEWNGRNDIGKALPSGVYFYRLSSGKFTATRKFILLK